MLRKSNPQRRGTIQSPAEATLHVEETCWTKCYSLFPARRGTSRTPRREWGTFFHRTTSTCVCVRILCPPSSFVAQTDGAWDPWITGVTKTELSPRLVHVFLYNPISIQNPALEAGPHPVISALVFSQRLIVLCLTPTHRLDFVNESMAVCNGVNLPSREVVPTPLGANGRFTRHCRPELCGRIAIQFNCNYFAQFGTNGISWSL